jgi:hypothetical protein
MQALVITALAFQVPPHVILPTVVAPRAAAPARNVATSSLLGRVFGTHHSLLDTPFSLLPRLIEEDFTRSLDLLNRAVGGLVHVETGDKEASRPTAPPPRCAAPGPCARKRCTPEC